MIKEDNLEYCDVSIYGQTCLRTCYSSKKGREYKNEMSKSIAVNLYKELNFLRIISCIYLQKKWQKKDPIIC